MRNFTVTSIIEESRLTNSPKKNAKGFPIIRVLLCIIILSAAAVLLAYFELRPVDAGDSEAVSFVVEKGQSVASIVKALAEQNLVRSEKLTYYAARWLKPALKAGTYRLSRNMSVTEIFAELATGKQRSVKVTIAEGLTVAKVAQTLEQAGVVPASEFSQLARTGEALKEYGIRADTCEGFLFPDTYFFTESETPESVLHTLVKTFFEKTSRIENFPTEPSKILEAVKLASIVEREYRVANEAPTIAGVFINRLGIRMALQSCTTIEYIITEIQHKPHPTRIFFADLEIDNPYNTYIHQGLPPTPICSPGLTALSAVANPEKHEYLYFRLTDEAAGTHSFSKTLSEHNSKGEGIKLKGN